MILHNASTRLALLPGHVTRLHLRAGTRLRGVRGTAWLTADGDPRDILLDARDEWVVEADARVLASALHADGRALVQLDECGADAARARVRPGSPPATAAPSP